MAACPTATLNEKAVAEIGKPERAVVTTCAYCGVGCTFRAEMRGEQLVRMVPWKDGKANHGHSCVKGRFAWGYANHADRITRPMIRERIDQPWRQVSWDEALAFTAARLTAIKAQYGARALGGITSSRCTNEEVFLVQKLVRAGFGTNNVDTCARVCHSPTGYGLKTTFGTSAGTQDFDSVDEADVILVIGASRMKRRLRQGAKLIVIDPRRIDLVKSPHIEAAYHLPLQPGTNVAVLTAMAHVIVTEGLADEAFIQQRCDADEYADWARFVADERHSPEVLEAVTRVPAADLRAAARLYATGGPGWAAGHSRKPNAAIYYGLGVTEHSQGSSTVMAIANLAMATGNIGRPGVGVNPLRGQNNVQGACDMGSFPHELSGYRHISDAATRARAQINSSLRLLGMHGSPDHMLHDQKNWHPQVIQLSALHAQGVDAFWSKVLEFRVLQTGSGKLAARRQQQALAWMWERIDAGLKSAFARHPAVKNLLPQMTQAVLDGRMAASTAARNLLQAQAEKT